LHDELYFRWVPRMETPNQKHIEQPNSKTSLSLIKSGFPEDLLRWMKFAFITLIQVKTAKYGVET
jgi:hypothetical protein